jgi:diaminopimelate decarboxylase
MTFRFEDGYLFCEDLRVKSIFDTVAKTPFYLYSLRALQDNYAAYVDALSDIPSIVSFAVKANGNLHILKSFCQLGSWATLVSGGELRLAIAAGFDPSHLIFNGNGKTISELSKAIDLGVILNIDSDFDLAHIQQIGESMGKSIDVLLRINPNIDSDVHPYISTAQKNAKFGVGLEQVPEILARILDTLTLNLVGLHCHLGSTITNLDVYRQTMELFSDQFRTIRQQGVSIKYINLGGGLGINYHKGEDDQPTPKDFVTAIRDLIPKDAILILEPGRSLVGNAGVLIGNTIGVKRGKTKKFIVTDASMTELLRPSLYNAYHHISLIEPVFGMPELFDIVGPVCESADFLGKARFLPPPPEGTGIVIFDTGAYGFVMSSNYNARPRPPEYMVDGNQLIQIRRAESFDDQMNYF